MLKDLSMIDSNYSNCLTEADWMELFIMNDLLKISDAVKTKISGTKYPTSN